MTRRTRWPINLLAAAASIGALACSSGPPGDAGGSAGGDPAAAVYPSLAALQAGAILPTCSLNQGVCHAQRDYPNLMSARDVANLVRSPCQIGVQDPSDVIDACEAPGDDLLIGGAHVEILFVYVPPEEPFPPHHVALTLSTEPRSLATEGAAITRPATAAAAAIDESLDGVVATAAGPKRVVLDLTGATAQGLARFLDVRVYEGPRVRMGDPNQDGVAHAAADPWAEIKPGDPDRSFFYQRLLDETLGPKMPLLARSWSPTATRAVYCFIRGLPTWTLPSSIDEAAPIDYESCPVDPNAPSTDEPGGFPALRALLGSKCATGPCHSPTERAGDLDLTPDAATLSASLINVPSSQVPGALRVVPGQPASSYLFCKVDPACTARAADTAQMPLTGGALDDTEIQTIADWIQGGAPLE